MDNDLIGIYKIVNKINEKVYVGLTTNLRTRKNRHFSTLKSNKHENVHLQFSVNKYGIKNFEFEIIEKCEKNELDEREKYWIKFYKSCDAEYGYNIDEGGSVDKKGKKISKKWKDNIKSAVVKNHGYSKNSESQIDEIIKLLLDGIDNRTISNITNISYNIVLQIRKKKTWVEYTKGLEFPDIRVIRSGKSNKQLTDEKVIEIINMMKNNLTNRQIIDKTGLTFTIINGIRNKETYQYLTKNEDIPNIKMNKTYNCKLTDEQVIEIINMINNNFTTKQIVNKFGITEGIIFEIRNKKSYKHITLNMKILEAEYRKFTDEQVLEIINMIMDKKFTTKQIADNFNTNEGTILRIKNKETYTHLTKDIDFSKYKMRDSKCTLTYEQVLKVIEMLKNGLTTKKISNELNISYRIVSHINYGESYKHLTQGLKFPIKKSK